MDGRPQTGTLLDLAEWARAVVFDAIWVGDPLLARPRHEPLTLLAAVVGRLPGIEVGTAVLLPALRNPVLLAQQVATLDQIAEGRLWIAGSLPVSLKRRRASRRLAAECRRCRAVEAAVDTNRSIAREAGRDPDRLEGAEGTMYLTLSADADVARANRPLDAYLEQYCGQRAAVVRDRQECSAGPPSGQAYLTEYARAGAAHLILRFAGDHARHLDLAAAVRSGL